jgi:hypothetical protein
MSQQMKCIFYVQFHIICKKNKSKQLKCIFYVQFHIIRKKNIHKKCKGCHFIKKVYFYDSCAIIIVCICKFIPVPMPRSADNP